MGTERDEEVMSRKYQTLSQLSLPILGVGAEKSIKSQMED
jgi:hypothetical protein